LAGVAKKENYACVREVSFYICSQSEKSLYNYLNLGCYRRRIMGYYGNLSSGKNILMKSSYVLVCLAIFYPQSDLSSER
jgi:hypothetical protein